MWYIRTAKLAPFNSAVKIPRFQKRFVHEDIPGIEDQWWPSLPSFTHNIPPKGFIYGRFAYKDVLMNVSLFRVFQHV